MRRGRGDASLYILMTGKREDFLEWDQLMEDVGVPKEKYSKMRADRIARLIVDSCPAHLSLSSWAELITKSIVELFPADDPDDEFAETPAIIDVGHTDNP